MPDYATRRDRYHGPTTTFPLSPASTGAPKSIAGTSLTAATNAAQLGVV